MKGERVAIFIDGSNLYHCFSDEFGTTDIDFYVFAELLCGEGRELVRIYYYNATVRREDSEKRYRDQQRFFDRLRKVDYLTLRLGRLERRGNTVVEKGVDVKLAVDMFRLAHNNAYDTAILVSGDGDFADAIEVIKDLGKHVENAFCKTGSSYHLRQVCDKFILVDKAMIQACAATKGKP